MPRELGFSLIIATHCFAVSISISRNRDGTDGPSLVDLIDGGDGLVLVADKLD
jgi:hypothetical protein